MQLEQTSNWYKVHQENQLDSPSLLIYRERVEQNIDEMIRLAGGVERLFPHIKTNKMSAVVTLLKEKGIQQVKCATLAEAELAASAGIQNVLVAHQLVGPKIERFIRLQEAFPETSFATLVDCLPILNQWKTQTKEKNSRVKLYIDVNNGMNRSGHEVNEDLYTLYHAIQTAETITFSGFHVYDGHLRDTKFTERQAKIEAGFSDFDAFLAKYQLTESVIAGGTPAFTAHALQPSRICSPGTSVFWDWGYGDALVEQPFVYAALLLTRIISKPTAGVITLDAGHKAMAAESPIDKRIRLLDMPCGYQLISQSEEHTVVRVENDTLFNVGDALYAVPYHVCPTVNLYDEAYVVQANQWVDTWQVEARKRRITY